uniref:Uncharacterized protein n=1 Tax=Romanomermis culicivorax TaxID=13658 RepID=A0A915IU08_ROMCU
MLLNNESGANVKRPSRSRPAGKDQFERSYWRRLNKPGRLCRINLTLDSKTPCVDGMIRIECVKNGDTLHNFDELSVLKLILCVNCSYNKTIKTNKSSSKNEDVMDISFNWEEVPVGQIFHSKKCGVWPAEAHRHAEPLSRPYGYVGANIARGF